MNKLAFLVSMLVASQALSQTLDIGTLSPYKQTMHRYGWCTQAYMSAVTSNQPGQPGLLHYEIGTIKQLLDSNGFTDGDKDRVHRKAANDLEVQLILGSKRLNQEDLDACFEDLKNILAENYVPNFKYLEN